MLLFDPQLLSVVAIFFSAVSAIAAVCAIWQARQSAREARQAVRPYFLLEEPGIKPLQDSPPFRIQLTLRNVGGRIAASLEGRLYVTSAVDDVGPAIDTKFSVANDIPPTTPTPWYADSLVLSASCPPHFVILGIKYLDPLQNKTFTQSFFMRWDGAQDGKFQPDFVHACAAEKALLEKRYASVITQY